MELKLIIDRMSANLRDRLLREGVWITLGHAITILAGLLSVRIFTELAPQHVFGGANLLIGIMVVSMHCLVAPVTQTQIRYQTEYSARGLGDDYERTVWHLAMGASAVAATPALAALIVWPDARVGAGLAVIPLLSVWIITTTAKSVVVGRLNAERRQLSYGLFIAAEALTILIATTVALFCNASIEALIAGQIIGTACPLLIFWARHGKPWRHPQDGWQIDSETLCSIWRYGLPFAPILLFEWLANQTDRYILASYMELSDVGIYAAAFAIASKPAMIVGGVLTDLLRPLLFADADSTSSKSDRHLHTWFVLQAISSTAVVIMFVSCGEEIAGLLLAEGYREGTPVLMNWIAAAYGIRALAMVLEHRAYAMEQPHRIAMIKVVPVIVGVGTAVFIIPVVGLVGAAMANFTAQLTYILACTVGYFRSVVLEIEGEILAT